MGLLFTGFLHTDDPGKWFRAPQSWQCFCQVAHNSFFLTWIFRQNLHLIWGGSLLFFKTASLSFHLLDKYWCFYRESVCAQQAVSFGLRHLVILGLCDLSRDYHSVLPSYISSPKCVTRSKRCQMTHLVVDYIPFVRFVRLPATVFFW